MTNESRPGRILRSASIFFVPVWVPVKVAAAGVNRPDVLQRQGGYASPPVGFRSDADSQLRLRSGRTRTWERRSVDRRRRRPPPGRRPDRTRSIRRAECASSPICRKRRTSPTTRISGSSKSWNRWNTRSPIRRRGRCVAFWSSCGSTSMSTPKSRRWARHPMAWPTSIVSRCHRPWPTLSAWALTNLDTARHALSGFLEDHTQDHCRMETAYCIFHTLDPNRPRRAKDRGEMGQYS